MPWDTIFTAANLLAMLAWAVLILAPRREIVFTLLRDGVIGLFCLLYAALLGMALFGPSGGDGGVDFSTIEGVRAIFAEDGGVTVGWLHYLAFDLFVGLWIARSSDEIALSRLVQAPILVATFLFGPFGLLVFLIVRRIHRAPKTA